ncbi:PorV/PorQ family protein [Chitinispirillales bacterium ANBcel5]|uniref:PorV/PorQ family protein n=1 Tax=Cellulosispirillum alkaliphilum TaxID=3039283 RepID=UPI002A59007D|nr:PorV/PorQ family protein [Chitinispirillales bacterium ANBcel5]
MKAVNNPKKSGKYLLLTALLLIYANEAFASQSAVITLAFPVGARPTALGEAFTGLANDANATFYNPAGLGLSPMASTWKTFLPDTSFNAVATKPRGEFGVRNRVWAGFDGGLLRFNGRAWENSVSYLLNPDDDLQSIVKRRLNIDDESMIEDAIWEIKKHNDIGMKTYALISSALKDNISSDIFEAAQKTPGSLARELSSLPPSQQNLFHVQSLLSDYVDSANVNTFSQTIVELFATPDRHLEDLLDIEIPYTIAIEDTVTAMLLDDSERLWIGTPKGLWRLDGEQWNHYTTQNGLPSNRITALSTGRGGVVAVGTDNGAAVFRTGGWDTIDSEHFPHPTVTSIAITASNAIYAGTSKGLLRKDNTGITVLDTSAGLISNSVTALFYDSQQRLWTGGEGGISINQGNRWRRFRFPDSYIYTFAEHNSGAVWIGTNQGVITYTEGPAKVSEDGTAIRSTPEWQTYHSRNVLRGDNVYHIAMHDNDVWLATDKAVQQYDYAERQFSFFYEQLLPEFNLPDLWHIYLTLVYPTEDWGTFGFFVNYINMGNNELTSESDVVIGEQRSWEGVFGLSYGFSIKEDLALGLNVKYVHSALAPGVGDHGEGVGRTFAVDASVLKKDMLIDNLDFGFMLQNMGPRIFYVSQDQADPIPFTLRLGLAYHAVQTPIHDLTFVFDAYREVVKNYQDDPPDPFWKALWTGMLANEDTRWTDELAEIILSLGAEYWYSDFVALRSGFMADYIGERYELTLGLGIKYGNLNFDWSYIHSPEGFMESVVNKINSQKTGANGSRHGQWRLSLLFSF